jgi:hypothetical protein
MNIHMISAFTDELEKIALTERGAEVFRKQVKEYRERASKPGFKRSQQLPGFWKGIINNIRATGRRFKNPKMMLKRFKWSLTAPGVPRYIKALSGLGIAYEAREVLKKGDEGTSRLRRALEGAGGLIGGTAGRGITGSIVGGTAGALIGSQAGKVIDKIRGYKPHKE